MAIRLGIFADDYMKECWINVYDGWLGRNWITRELASRAGVYGVLYRIHVRMK